MTAQVIKLSKNDTSNKNPEVAGVRFFKQHAENADDICAKRAEIVDISRNVF